MKRKIAHIINPVVVGEKSDLFFAQPVTFETMRVARELARPRLEVELLTAQYPEDHAIIPADFHKTPDLQRSVLDIGSFQKQRKLPLIADVLDRLFDASDAEFFIYTNVDIAVQPHFYLTVNAMIDSGLDAFVINRRTISAKYDRLSEIPLMYADVGKKHEGYDCFVFRRAAYPKFQLGAICIGIPRIGRVLLWNLISHAEKFYEFTKKHVTFHIGPGNDNAWQGDSLSDYRAHNVAEAHKILHMLERTYGALSEAVKSPFYENIQNENLTHQPG